SFQADLEDGSYVWAQLSFTNMGPGSGTALCRVLVRRPGRAPFQAQTRVGREDWAYAPEDSTGTDRLELDQGLCAAHGGSTPGLRIALDGQRVELSFRQPLLPTVPPGGEVRVPSGRYYRSELLLPFGDVSVQLEGRRVAQEGGTERLEGGAYVDHSRSTVKPSELASRWVRFRALRASPRTLLLAREAPDGSLGHAYLWEEGQAPLALSELALSREGEGGATAWLADFDAAGAVSSTGLLHRSAPVQELGRVLGSLLRPLLGSPVTYTHRAVLQREGAPPLPGLLEVSLEED
ncbi:MAG TPA: hypothetical protein VFO83_07040, partial [Aggregicoccus sp.]|nr:hypothetical protein [Aggregicoccus sp.]